MNAADTAWIIVATALVLFMTLPGLALFYGGLVRARNVLSVFMQCFGIACLMSVLWLAFGYSIAFGTGTTGYWGGLGHMFLSGVDASTVRDGTTLPEVLFFAFQMTFAIITPALIVGAYVERIGFGFVMTFSGLWMLLCYAPVVHWVWGGGWLGEMGLLDFAGGTVVHINAGIAALVLALLIGPRIGFGKEPMPPHNMPMTLIGAALLWAGWFGFNVGSELAADGVAGAVMINTQIAAAAAVLGWLFIESLQKGKASLLGGVSGAISGLVAITPACAVVGPMGAIILGFVASIFAYWACTSLKKAIGYDDSLDVFGIHGVAGIVGALGLAILMSPTFGGVGFDEGVSMASQFVIQAKSVGVTIVWCAIATFVLYKIVNSVVGMRVSDESERTGLDTTSHGETAYHS